MSERIVVLANPAAGKGRSGETVTQVEHQLRKRSQNVQVVAEDTAERSRQSLTAAIHDGVDRVICVGGDGLVNLAVQQLAETAIALGVVAGGTGNDFARALALPTETTEAVEAALGEPLAIDAIHSRHGWAATIVTQGFSVTTNRVANALPWPTGGRRYVVATGLALPALRTARTIIEVDGKAHDCDATIVAIGNTRYFGSGTAICPDADPTDAMVDVVVIGPLTRRQLVFFYNTVEDRSFLANPLVKMFRGSSVTITGGATGVWADGEPYGPDQRPDALRLQVRPGALLVAGASVPTH